MSSIGQKLMKGSAFRVGSFAAQLAVAFLLTPFIIHSLGERLYGFWTLIATFIGYYGLLDMGLSSAVARYLAKAIGGQKDHEINKLYNTALVLFSCMGIVVVLVTFVAIGLAPLFIQSPEDIPLFQIVILILGVNVAISFPVRVFVGVLNAQLEFQLVSLIQLGSLFLRTILIVSALTIGYKICALALISFFVAQVGNVLYIHFAKRKLPIIFIKRNEFNRDTVRILFSYSFFAFISSMADMLIFNVDVFIIGFSMSLSAVTHYQIAAMLVTYYNQLIGHVIGVLKSFFSRKEGEQDQHGTKKALYFGLKISTTVSCFVGFGFIFWGAQFIERWVGGNFLDAYPCLVVLTLAMFLGLCQTPAIALLYGTSKHRIYAQINVVEGLANLVLSLILVRLYGILGVAYGTFIPMVFTRIFVFPYYFCKVTENKYLDYVKSLISTILKSLIALILPFIIANQWLTPDYLSLFTIALVSLFLYSATVYFLVYNSTERIFLSNTILSFVKKRSTVV